MLKQVVFPSHIHKEGRVRRVIYPVYPGSDGAFTKVAQHTCELHPEIRQFTQNLKPDPDHIYVLVVALGAGESWSSNVNGDWFSREDLKKNHPSFVAKAKVFHLHDNKPNSESYGEVLFSRFNDNMDRVELIISVLRDGLPEVVSALEKNELIDLSMGTRVEFDVCSICRNKARRFSEYCEHLRYEMNKIYPNGKKVYAENPNPDFFDISFVDSGADRTSKALLKVAAESGNRHIIYSALLGEKVSKEKDAVLDKGISMVEKALPEKLKTYWEALGHGIESKEKLDLRKLNKDIPINDALNVATSNKVLLRPSEFFSFLLDRLGFTDKANAIWDNDLSLWDDTDCVADLGDSITGNLPLALPNIFSLNRSLEPNGITTRFRIFATNKTAQAKLNNKPTITSVTPEIDRKLCGLYRDYVKQASHVLLKTANISGTNLLASLAATVLLGKALLESSQAHPLIPDDEGPVPVYFESSDILGVDPENLLNDSSVTESTINEQLTKQRAALERIRRGSPESIDTYISKLSAVAKVPTHILATSANCLQTCGTKTAQVGKLLTETNLLPAVISLKFKH